MPPILVEMQGALDRIDNHAAARLVAAHLYEQVRSRAKWKQIMAKFLRRSRSLHCFPLELVNEHVRSEHHQGVQVVPLVQIRGSEARCRDFDVDFQPLQEHTEARWINVATATQTGKRLPPVDLIQIGDRYYVRDGHHRISVARARGQENIEATVTRIQVA